MLFKNWPVRSTRLPNCRMSSNYPPGVIDKILQITLENQAIAFLAIDQSGVLIKRGGDLPAMGVPRWNIGENVLDSADFLVDMLPLSTGHEFLPLVQTSDTDIVDVHLFEDEDVIWIILVDKSEDLEWQMLARQRSNELMLLQQKFEGLDDVRLATPEVSLIFQALNMAALVHKGDGSFTLLRPPAPVFTVFYPEIFENKKRYYPQERFCFIENFLVDAQSLWDSGENHRRIRSGPWIDKTLDGDEVVLEALALNWEERALLLIEVLEENYQQQHRVLQIGREGKLARDVLEKEVRKRTRQIREREEEITLRLVCAADCRDDGETGSHIRRLGLYSEVIARHLGWEQNLIDAIRIAAPMHDIGKIGIPDHILKKADKLTDAEFEIMKLHPEIGARILANSESELVQMAHEIALGHHERWDGSGYPFGLSGSDIAISARIVAIVDVFDALIHKRVYKKAISVDDALDQMGLERGKQFDPQLFDLFLELREEMERVAVDNTSPVYGGFSDEFWD